MIDCRRASFSASRRFDVLHMVLCGQIQLRSVGCSPGPAAYHLSALAAPRRQSGLLQCVSVGQWPSSSHLNARTATSHVGSRCAAILCHVITAKSTCRILDRIFLGWLTVTDVTTLSLHVLYIVCFKRRQSAADLSESVTYFRNCSVFLYIIRCWAHDKRSMWPFCLSWHVAFVFNCAAYYVFVLRCADKYK